jgi:hypothetical protein
MLILTDGVSKQPARQLTIGPGLILTEDVNGLPVISTGISGAGAGVAATIIPDHLIPFSVEGLSGPVSITVASGTAEVTPRVRVRMSFKGYGLARLQLNVALAGSAGEQFACKWYDTVTSSWRWLGTDAAGANGPVVALDTAGDIAGASVAIDVDLASRSDVVVGLFAIGA